MRRGRPTVASLDCPTIIRREWYGYRTTPAIIAALAEFFTRWRTGELLWR